MNVMKSFRVSMAMSYAKYDSVLVGYESIDFSAILDKFVKDMFNGPREEIAKFFNLDSDDLNDMKEDNFMIGYKIESNDEENKYLHVIVKLDILLKNQKDEMPSNIVDIDENPASFEEGASIFDKIDEAAEESEAVAESDYNEVEETEEVSEEDDREIEDEPEEESEDESEETSDETKEETSEEENTEE